MAVKKTYNAEFTEYFELQAQIEELQKKQDEIKAKLRAAAESEEDKKWVEGRFQVSVTNCTRNTFDTKAFAVNHPKLAAKFTKTTEYTQCKILQLKKEKDA